MNICILNHRENNPYIGGVEKISYTLAHLWKDRGYSVIFLSLQKSEIIKEYHSDCDEFFLPNNDNVCSIENRKFIMEIFHKYQISIVINQANVFPKVCALARMIKQNFPIKLITTIHYAPLFELAGIENNFFLSTKKGIKNNLFSLLLFLRYYCYQKRNLIRVEAKRLQDTASYSDFVVCLSEKFIPAFRKLLAFPIYYDKLVAIPNTVELTKNIDSSKKKKQVLYVGRLEYGLKRVDRILEIWKGIETEFKDWNLCIVGDGNSLESLKQLAKTYKLENISFEGFRDPKIYFAESSIFCLTSSSEGFGLVLVEALMAKCVPIVYNSFLSVTDIIENGTNGILIKPFKKKSFIAELKKLMVDSSERERLAQNNMVTLKKFEPSVILNQWDNLFSKL